MLNDKRFCGDLNSEMDLTNVFDDIRLEVRHADVAISLSELYKLAGFLTALTDAPCWKIKFGSVGPDFGKLSREEFRKTAKEINYRAEQIGCELRFSEILYLSSCPEHRGTPRRPSAVH